MTTEPKGEESISICLQRKAAGLLRPDRSVKAKQADGSILLLRKALGHWSEAPGDQVIKFIGGRPESKGKTRCWGLRTPFGWWSFYLHVP